MQKTADSSVRPTRRHEPLAAALWMILSCALLSGLSGLVRYVALEGVPPLQIVFIRVLFALITLSPLLLIRGPSFAKTKRLKIYGWRAIAGTIAMTTWFSSLAYITIGEVTAISFLAPLFATVGAALFLSEVVRIRRWVATLIGFAGALIILRPGIIEFTLGSWLALAAAFGMGLSTLFLKSLTDHDDPDKVVFISSALMTPITLVPALFVWTWPDPYLWLLMIAMGPIATLGHVTLTRAFAAADASFVMSFDFARLPFAVAFGFALFGESVDLWTWVGAGIIFGASLYIAHRETQLKRQLAPVSVGPVNPRV